MTDTDYESFPVGDEEVVWHTRLHRYIKVRPIVKRPPPEPDPDNFLRVVGDILPRMARKAHPGMQQRYARIRVIMLEAGRPMSIPEVTNALAAKEGVDMNDKKEMYRLLKRVQMTFTRRKHDFVLSHRESGFRGGNLKYYKLAEGLE